MPPRAVNKDLWSRKVAAKQDGRQTTLPRPLPRGLSPPGWREQLRNNHIQRMEEPSGPPGFLLETKGQAWRSAPLTGRLAGLGPCTDS